LAHDPEKHALGLDLGVASGFGKDHAQTDISADFAVLKCRRLL
jgi:hypothetical protein